MSGPYTVDATHFSLVQSLKNTIRKIKREKQNGLDELRRNHYLQGTFSKLCEREHFQELAFPGFSREALRGLPKSLVEIFEWEELQLDIDSIATNAGTVLKNIKAKGGKQGQIMDAETEKVLLPQIAQEALAKRVLEEIQKLNRKVNSMIANSIKPIAALTDERAERDLLDEEIGYNFRQVGFAGQPSFMGNDWIPIIQKDLLRFVRDEKMSFIDANGAPIGDVRVEETPLQRIAWLEQDEDFQENYPALYEIIDNLQSLAYEINAKGLCPDLTLLEPGKGCTLLTIHPVGSEQRMRLDTRQNVDGFDSGIRVTACYNIHLRIEDTAQPSDHHIPNEFYDEQDVEEEDGNLIQGFGEIHFALEPKRLDEDDEDISEIRRQNSKNSKAMNNSNNNSNNNINNNPINGATLDITHFPIKDDLLTIHRSADIRNGRTAEYWSLAEAAAQIPSLSRRRNKTPGIVWATIHHFICGRDVRLTSAPLAVLSRQISSVSSKKEEAHATSSVNRK